MLLECTCSSCGKLLLTDDQVELIRNKVGVMENGESDSDGLKELFKKIHRESLTKKVCPHCGEEQVKIKLDKPTTFRAVDDNHKLTPLDIRKRLENIPDDVLSTLGMDPTTCRPEWMILTVLAVPPVTVRPSITLDSGDRSEDDLTHKLVDVLRINERLRENRDNGAPQLIVDERS